MVLYDVTVLVNATTTTTTTISTIALLKLIDTTAAFNSPLAGPQYHQGQQQQQQVDARYCTSMLLHVLLLLMDLSFLLVL